MNEQDPRQVLARRLRALREEHWPERKVNQAQLAAALGGDGNRRQRAAGLVMGVADQPKGASGVQDSRHRQVLRQPRSFDGKAGRLLSLDELTAEERAAEEGLSGTDAPAERGA